MHGVGHAGSSFFLVLLLLLFGVCNCQLQLARASYHELPSVLRAACMPVAACPLPLPQSSAACRSSSLPVQCSSSYCRARCESAASMPPGPGHCLAAARVARGNAAAAAACIAASWRAPLPLALPQSGSQD